MWSPVFTSIRQPAVPLFSLLLPFQSPSPVYYIIFQAFQIIAPLSHHYRPHANQRLFVQLTGSHKGRGIFGYRGGKLPVCLCSAALVR